MVKVVVVAALFTSAWAGVLTDDHVQANPMYSYKQDCGTKSALHINPAAASLLQGNNVPGAGIAAFKPFETVLKDGFMGVDCIKDYMYYRGDKFGDNKHDYKLGPVSNVSIVHYADTVAKMDQVEMTQAVCFEFCRTVPNMGFFGIVNGRGCYCTPYFQSMASSSEECDSVCEGDKTTFCGGKSKSSVFAMHMCASTGEDLNTRSQTALALKADIDSKVTLAKTTSTQLQKAGEGLQNSFGQVGDSGAANAGQQAKVFAGTLVHKAEEAGKVADKLGELAAAAGKLSDFTDPAQVTAAERIMEDIDQEVAMGEGVSDELEHLQHAATPKESAGAAAQYYPVMYFVDKEFKDVPSTCSGDSVGEPMIGSADACAAACDNAIHDCVGYQFFDMGGGVSGCGMLSKFKTGFYYTGCGDAGKKSFLQTSEEHAAAPFSATCFAKLSKFEGTTLKPNPSGKCEQCFNELTKADRCY